MVTVIFKEAKATVTSTEVKVDALKLEISEYFVSIGICLFSFGLRFYAFLYLIN